MDILSLPLDILLREPSRLEASISGLQNQFDDSMARNYDYFIETCTKASTITEDLEQCSSMVLSLNQQIEEAVNTCEDLSVVASNLQTSSKSVTSAFKYFPLVSDILAVPQLMKGCRVSGLHEEAIQLYSTLENLSRRILPTDSVQKTLEEAKRVRNDVIQSVYDSFGVDGSLSEFVKAVNLLKIANNEEQEICLGFITGKLGKMKKKIDVLSKAAPLVYLEKYTEVYRSCLYELCTQYQALFGEEDSPFLQVAMHSEIKNYCSTLKEYLNIFTEENDARSALQSAFFFGSSFNRIGFDFTRLIDAAFRESKWKK